MGKPSRPRLVLASSSPRRGALLARLGLTPVLRPGNVDERPRPGEPPAALASRLAHAKALAAQRAQPPDADDEVVIGADTVVALDAVSLGKPASPGHARRMLRALAGRVHLVLTAVAVHRGTAHHLEVVTTQVRMRPLTDAEVDWYVATGEPVDKAGGYALQGAGAALVAGIEGSDTNVIGLPLAETVLLLRRVGLDVLVAQGSAAPGSAVPGSAATDT